MAHVDLSIAEHEAAHVVVGLALGLKLRQAFVRRQYDPDLRLEVDGLTYFGGGKRRRLAIGIMACAGIVWEARLGRKGFDGVDVDRRLARDCFTSAHDVASGMRIAREMLDGRRRAHARLASELCERDLTAADVERLVIDG